MNNIKATIIADSISEVGHRITTFILTYPRIIHSELMTHRMFSRNSSSCLTGDTIITIESPNKIKKNLKSASNNMTIKEIVDKWIDGDSLGRTLRHRLKPMYLRCLNEDTGEFITTHITDCFRQGIQDIYEIELTNGYKIKCTKNHRIFTNQGWKTLNDINLNFSHNNILNWDNHTFKIATNGFELTKEWLVNEKKEGKTLVQICNEYNLNYKLISRFSQKHKIPFHNRIPTENETFEYKNKEWLEQKLKEGLFSTDIALLCNTTYHRVKRSMRKFKLKGNKFTWGSKPTWNKGKKYTLPDSSLINIRESAKNRIKPHSYKTYKNFYISVTRFLNTIRKEILIKYNYKCQVSDSTRNLQLHHIIPIWYNPKEAFNIDNIILLNKDVHRFIHSNNLDIDFMNYYNEGKDLSQFQELYKDLKLKCIDINKPKSQGNPLIVRFYDIKKINYIGKEETYDLEVSGNYHNFVANKIVVHNSRAIPFEKMLEEVETNPFIPIAFQYNHKGMQGTHYFNDYESIKQVETIWLQGRDKAIETAKSLYYEDVTKQLCNRLLEPYMYHTTLVTATEWDNFFELRCPKYEILDGFGKMNYYKSKNEIIKTYTHCNFESRNIRWYEMNKSQAEIHIQDLAEKMYDAYNQSNPILLKENEWHIPFMNNINIPLECYEFNTDEELNDIMLKIAVARCARISYNNHNNDFDINKDIDLYNRLLNNKHMSAFEHCAKVMTEKEYQTFRKGVLDDENSQGWNNNFKGFIQLRYIVE